jgi:multiple antibiotic resistance protein
MQAIFDSALLMFALLNPFLMGAYLIELIRECTFRDFATILLRASLIAGTAFIAFAAGGEAVFREVLQVRFESFMVFGGLVFLITGLRMTLTGQIALINLRGTPGQVAGSIALPFLVGPGTVSAAVVIGNRLPLVAAITAIVGAIVASFASILAFKLLHDWVRNRHEELVERYVEIAGRVTALFVGTYAIEMLITAFERISAA